MFFSAQAFISNKGRESGASLVEVLIAVGLFTVFAPALLTGFVTGREAKPQNDQRQQALSYLREAKEALRVMAQTNWDEVDDDGPFYPEINGNTWVTTPGFETIGLFTRTVDIADVYRNSSGTIVTSGGTEDPSTREATITVSWTTPRTSSVSETIYLTRYFDNSSWEQDLQGDFDDGNFNNTVSTEDDDGEVELDEGTSGGGDWVSPTFVGAYENSNNTDAYAVEVSGDYAYVGYRNGANDEFTILDVSDPPSPTKAGGYDVGGSVWDIGISGNYAYLATGDNNEELIILDVSNKSNPAFVHSVDLGDNRDAYTVAYDGSQHVFVGKDSSGGSNREIYGVDILPLGTDSVSSTVELGSDVNYIQIVGSYMFVANDSDDELLVYDISNPSSLTLAGSFNAAGGANAEFVLVDGNRAYLGRRNSSSPDLYILDISNLGSISEVSSYDTGEHINSIAKSGDLLFLANNDNNESLRIFDISDEGNPQPYGIYDANGDCEDVVVVGTYAYLACDDNSAEFKIVEGGTGSGGSYETSGDFESQSFNAGNVVAFNYVDFSITEPVGTDMNFQIATNNDDSTWNFVGPDGTSGTYYESPGAIPLANVLGQYFRFKAFFTGDGSDTPILEDFSVNYSP